MVIKQQIIRQDRENHRNCRKFKFKQISRGRRVLKRGRPRSKAIAWERKREKERERERGKGGKTPIEWNNGPSSFDEPRDVLRFRLFEGHYYFLSSLFSFSSRTFPNVPASAKGVFPFSLWESPILRRWKVERSLGWFLLATITACLCTAIFVTLRKRVVTLCTLANFPCTIVALDNGGKETGAIVALVSLAIPQRKRCPAFVGLFRFKFLIYDGS